MSGLLEANLNSITKQLYASGGCYGDFLCQGSLWYLYICLFIVLDDQPTNRLTRWLYNAFNSTIYRVLWSRPVISIFNVGSMRVVCSEPEVTQGREIDWLTLEALTSDLVCHSGCSSFDDWMRCSVVTVLSWYHCAVLMLLCCEHRGTRQ